MNRELKKIILISGWILSIVVGVCLYYMYGRLDDDTEKRRKGKVDNLIETLNNLKDNEKKKRAKNELLLNSVGNSSAVGESDRVNIKNILLLMDYRINGDKDEFSDSIKEYNRVISQMIEKENRLTNDRMLWMLSINGALLALLGFALEKKDKLLKLVMLFCVIGILCNFSLGIAIQNAILALDELKKHRDRIAEVFKNDDIVLPPVIGLGPDETGQFQKFLLPWYLLPRAFCLLWLTLLIYRIWTKSGFIYRTRIGT